MYCLNVNVFDLTYKNPKISTSVRASVGSVVDTDTCHPVDGCSSPRTIQAVLLTFDSLFDSTLQGTRSWPGQPFPFCVLGKTEKKLHAHTNRYRHILAYSSKYTHIHADTIIYILIRVHTYIIQVIHANTNIYMYIHTSVCMCMYCMYLSVLYEYVCIVCIACIYLYCMYMYVLLVLCVWCVSVCIRMYCMY